MAKFAFASDLHLEFLAENTIAMDTLRSVLAPNPENADAFVLAGDIIEARLLAVSDDSTKVEVRDGAFALFEDIAENYPQVFWILGNHEHYRGTLEKTKSIAEEATKHIPNFKILENDVDQVGDVKVFGATFWTDCGGPANEWFVQRGMNDYKLIKTSNPTYRKLGTRDTVREHARSVTMLREFLGQNTTEKVAVFTHHAPHLGMIAERYRNRPNDYIQHAFWSDQTGLMNEHDNLLLWVSGHTHARIRDKVGNTDTVSNALGYIGFEIGISDIANFRPGIIEI